MHLTNILFKQKKIETPLEFIICFCSFLHFLFYSVFEQDKIHPHIDGM